MHYLNDTNLARKLYLHSNRKHMFVNIICVNVVTVI